MMRGCTVADLTGANFHYMVGTTTLCGITPPAAWRMSDYDINCTKCARIKCMAAHPAGKGLGAR